MMNKTADGARIERLNLATSYPVRWSAYTVLRDFIQNFYDSLGPEKFGQDFEYAYDAGAEILSMRAGKGFSLDWLLYIGTSSKRGDRTQGAVGKFGEGFKIAALCAYRDLHWGIRMASRDWVVRVTEAVDGIDGESVPVLAYEVSEREFREEAVLILAGVKAEDYDEAFHWVLEDFYYPENPALGDVIASGNDWIVYKPGAGNRGRVGALYAGYLRRAGLDEPIIVCNHSYKSTDSDGRERENFRCYEANRCMLDAVQRMQPADALAFLEAIPRRWDGKARQRDSGHDWPGIVKALIRRVAEDEGAARRFLSAHGDDLLADFAPVAAGASRAEKAAWSNRRGMAMGWWHREMRQTRVVLPEFEKLGILDLDGTCKVCGGYEQLREPNATEQQRVKILERAAQDVFGALLCYPDGLPSTRIIINKPPQLGSAHVHPAEGGQKNKIGVPVKYKIESIQLQTALLHTGMFPEALSTYMHELLHQVGGDSSGAFRRMLTLMASRMYIAGDELFLYEVAWDALDAGTADGQEGGGGDAGDV